MAQRIGGVIQLAVNGVLYNAEGHFDYDIGISKKEMKVGTDRVHGYTESPTVPYIEGAITDTGTLSLSTLAGMTGASVTLELSNGKVIVLRDAVFAGNSKGNTEAGKIDVRWEGMSGEEVA